MNSAVVVSIISVVTTILTFAFGFIYKFIRDIIKDLGDLRKELDAKITLVAQETDNKINGVFRRLDEVKDSAKKEFVRKDICNISHSMTKSSVDELKADFKAFAKTVFEKIDELIKTKQDNNKED